MKKLSTNIRNIMFFTLASYAMLSLPSCRHKDLCYEHPHVVTVNVVFDWAKAKGASPRSMSFYLFPKDGGEAVRYDFPNNVGGTVKVLAGEYDAMCLNSDTEDILYRGNVQPDAFLLTTETVSLLSTQSLFSVRSDDAPRSRGTEDERVAQAPEMIWSGNLSDLVFRKGDDGQTVTFYPDTSVCIYTVEIHNAPNLEYVKGMSGSLSTLAGGLYPAIEEVSDEKVTVPFATTLRPEEDLVTARFYVFGDSRHANTDSHSLTIYSVLTDGTKWYYTYDVTNQVDRAPDPRHVHIVLDGLPLPKPIVNGSGLHPIVDEWQTVNINIPM